MRFEFSKVTATIDENRASRHFGCVTVPSSLYPACEQEWQHSKNTSNPKKGSRSASTTDSAASARSRRKGKQKRRKISQSMR